MTCLTAAVYPALQATSGYVRWPAGRPPAQIAKAKFGTAANPVAWISRRRPATLAWRRALATAREIVNYPGDEAFLTH